MENRNIIIVLIVIIVILAVVVGILFTQSINAKEPTKIRITSNKTLYEGDNLSIKLTDLNKTPLSKEKVNITIKNGKGEVVVDDVVKTNSKGKAKLDLNLKKGKYNVDVSYGGNENYTTQKLTIKEEVKQSISEESYSSSAEGYTTEPVYDGHTLSYRDGVRGVYSKSGEFFVDPTQDPNYKTF